MVESIFLVTPGRFREWGKNMRQSLLKPALQQVQVPEMK